MAISPESHSLLWCTIFFLWLPLGQERSPFKLCPFALESSERPAGYRSWKSHKRGGRRKYRQLVQRSYREHPEYSNWARAIQLHANGITLGQIRHRCFQDRFCAACRIGVGSVRQRPHVDPNWLRYLSRAGSQRHFRAEYWYKSALSDYSHRDWQFAA